ncbi:MAG: glutamate mutase L [Bacillota bacterium]
MKDLALLCDLGSTFTKVVAVEVASGSVIAWAKAPSTVDADVTEGLEQAIREAERQGGFRWQEARWRLASSSAAGGLRMVAVGLVPELTGEAARRAALGAGAKVVGVFCYELTDAEVRDLEEARPDIILLAGGTDGGNKGVLLHNARCLARARSEAPVVVAGNKVVAGEVGRVLREAGKEVFITENVLPSLGSLNVEPARRVIREVFIRRIVRAKGFDRAGRYVEGVLMPTPTAVLRAAEVLAGSAITGGNAAAATCCPRASGHPAVGGRPGGAGAAVLVVDVGGATTDVHSVGRGDPSEAGLIPKGLPEPESKRTVEGDLGVRCNAPSILEATGPEGLSARLRVVAPEVEPMGAADLEAEVQRLARETWRLPADDRGVALDAALAAAAVDLAVSRHAGQVEELYTPGGKVSVLVGKDLREFGLLVGTGGPLVSNPHRRLTLEAALWDPGRPHVLKPRRPRMLVDQHYIMFAAGLLAERDPEAAGRVLQGNLVEVDH